MKPMHPSKPIRAIAAAGIIAGPSFYIARRAQEMSRVAAELRNPALLVPFSATNAFSLRLLRSIAARPTRPVPGVVVEERYVSGEAAISGGEASPPGQPLRLITYDPAQPHANPDSTRGALLWIHSGGRVAGTPEADHRICSYLAQESGALVVSVDYRLAPEHPFPAGLSDVVAALQWLSETAAEFGVDPHRLAIGGASAGGGLAAEASQWAIDAGVPVAFQLLVYPMLDDRTIEADPDGRGQFIWTAASNRFSWTAYLGHAAGEAEPRAYAVAARRADLRGLPPAWIGVGELDLFYAEDRDYAQRLLAAGVPCTLDVVPGMYHGADVLPRPPKSMRDFWGRMAAALSAAIG